MNIAGRILKRKAYTERAIVVVEGQFRFIAEEECQFFNLKDVIAWSLKIVKTEMMTKRMQVKMFFKKLSEHAHEMHEEERYENSWYDGPDSSSGYGS